MPKKLILSLLTYDWIPHTAGMIAQNSNDYELVLIYKDTTVIILQHPTAIAVEIVNQEIADSFQAYFEEFWRKSKSFKA